MWKFAIWEQAGYSSSNPSISRFLFNFPNFLRSQVLCCSATLDATRTFNFRYNNLVLFHLLRRDTVLKSEKVYKFFAEDCLLVFTSLKMHGISKKYQVLVEKSKPHYKCCPTAIGTALITKFVLAAKAQISVFWNKI